MAKRTVESRNDEDGYVSVTFLLTKKDADWVQEVADKETPPVSRSYMLRRLILEAMAARMEGEPVKSGR